MANDRKEPRTERVNISLRPSTLAVLERLSAATNVAVPSIITELVEGNEFVFKAGAMVGEKQKAAREKAARAEEERLRRLVAGRP